MSFATIETVDGALEKYFERTEARFAENTLKNRRVAVSQFIEYLEIEGDAEVEVFDSVAKMHLEDWIDQLLLDDYAPRSIRNKVYCISSLYEFLVGRELAEENPVESVDTSAYTGNKIDEFTESRYITVDEFQQMLDETHKTRNELLLRLLWNTGMRAKEAINTTRADINLDERQIIVTNAKSSETDSKRTRTVYISRYLARMIEKWYDTDRRAYLGVSEDDDQHLLVTKQAPRMAVNRVTEIVGEIAERAGIQEVFYTSQDGRDRRRVTAHAFRHSYCVHRVKQGMPLVYLQSLAGHQDISQTREYLRFRDDDIEEAERNYRPTL